MNVILINPIPMKEGLRNKSLHLPYGPLYIARSLIDAGYKVSIIYTDNETALRTIHRLVSKDTVCFGMSTMSGTQLSNAIYLASALKARYPKIPIIWGGVHVTALPEETLRSEFVDYIVWGEGENIVAPLIEKIISGDSLYDMMGIGFKEGKGVFIGKNSGYTPLNKIFKLPYHLLDMEQYARKLIIGASREFPLWASRGCPYRCRFCSNASEAWPNTKVRFHTTEHVVNDIKTLVNEYGADLITFEDENFLMNAEHFIEILKTVKRDGISVKYRFGARIDILLRLKEQIWKAMKEYGVIAIGTAPESGSQKILDYMGKRITLNQIYQVNDLLSKYGFYKTFNILICTPEETKDDLKLTLKLVCHLARTSLSSPYALGTLYKYIPLPGTELYKDSIKHGFIPPTNLLEWGKFDIDNIAHTKSVVRPWISDEYLLYIERAIHAVENINNQLLGDMTNVKAVQKAIIGLERLISE